MDNNVNDLKISRDLLDSSALSHEGPLRAKQIPDGSKVNDLDASEVDPMHSELQLDEELLHIDQDWYKERQYHRVCFFHDNDPKIPTAIGAVGSLFAGLIAIGFGVFWIGESYSIGSPVIFPIMGFVFITVSISIPIYHLSKYMRYRSACNNYKRRRSAVLARFGKT